MNPISNHQTKVNGAGRIVALHPIHHINDSAIVYAMQAISPQSTNETMPTTTGTPIKLIYIIVGSSLALLLIIVSLIYCCIRRPRAQSFHESYHSNDLQHSYNYNTAYSKTVLRTPNIKLEFSPSSLNWFPFFSSQLVQQETSPAGLRNMAGVGAYGRRNLDYSSPRTVPHISGPDSIITPPNPSRVHTTMYKQRTLGRHLPVNASQSTTRMYAAHPLHKPSQRIYSGQDSTSVGVKTGVQLECLPKLDSTNRTIPKPLFSRKVTEPDVSQSSKATYKHGDISTAYENISTAKSGTWPSGPASLESDGSSIHLPYSASVSSLQIDRADASISPTCPSQEQNYIITPETSGHIYSLEAGIRGSEINCTRKLPTRDENSKNSGHSSSSKGSTLNEGLTKERAKRFGLGLMDITCNTKHELYSLRSLGSRSFDSIISYLKESDDPHCTNDFSSSSRSEGKSSNYLAESSRSIKKVSQDDTKRVDEVEYMAWVGSLDTSLSLLHMAYNSVGNSTSTCGAMRRRRNTDANISNIQHIRKETTVSKVSPKTTGGISTCNQGAPKPYRHEKELLERGERLDENKNEQDGIEGDREGSYQKEDVACRRLSSRDEYLTEAANRTRSGSQGHLSRTHGPGPMLEMSNIKIGVTTLVSSVSLIPSSTTQLEMSFPSKTFSDVPGNEESTSTNSLRLIPADNGRGFTKTVSTPSKESTPTLPLTADQSIMKSVAYISRCAPTPRMKPATALHSFLSYTPMLPLNPCAGSTGLTRQSSFESSESDDSNGTWGRRSVWDRGSPEGTRFDRLLRALGESDTIGSHQ